MNTPPTNGSRPSSHGFAATLAVDTWARRLVGAAALATLPAALWLIAGLPLPRALKWLLAVAFGTDLAWQVARLVRQGRKLVAIRVDAAGSVLGFAPDGDAFALQLQDGSVIGRRIVWLRLRFPDGRRHAELLLARNADAAAWHRFRLVTSLAGRRFGHPDGP